MNKKMREYIATKVNDIDHYWESVGLDSIIRVTTKAGLEFCAIRLPNRDIPGYPPHQTLTYIRLDDTSPQIRIMILDDIEAINGKSLQIKNKWFIKGSKGNTYIVKCNGASYECSCPAFKFSGKKRICKHIKELQKKA